MTKYLFIILILLQACSTSKVVKYLDDELDYGLYKTYRLINYKSDDKSYDQEGLIFFTQVENAINQNMADKNYAVSDRPDLIARYEIVSTTTVENNVNNRDPYGNRNRYYTPSNWNNIKNVEGVILIELRDRKLKKLVWQGSLNLKYSKREDAHETLTKSIHSIFTTYPYQAGSNEKIISP